MTDHSKTSQDLRTLIASNIAHARDYAEHEGFMVSTVCLPPEQADIVIAALSTPPRPDHAGGVEPSDEMLLEFYRAAWPNAEGRAAYIPPSKLADLRRGWVAALKYAPAQAPPQAAEREGLEEAMDLVAYWRKKWCDLNSKFDALAPSPNGTEASQGVILPGWRLVPVEPTKDMLNAIWTHGPFSKAQLTASYNDLLAATPTPPVSPPDSTGQGEGWQPIAELKPQTNAVLGRWSRCGDNEDGSEFWYWQEATGRWFEHLGEAHWCLRAGSFDQGPFYGEAPTHFHAIPEKPARPSQADAQTQEGGE